MKRTYSLPSALLWIMTVGPAMLAGSPCHGQESSVLSSGPSLKIGVTEDGIYRIRYEDLEGQGLLDQAGSSSRIALYGKKAGMLPFFNTPGITRDLVPIPIQMQDGGDGMFGPGDYFLFAGQSPHVWTYDQENGFLHQTNYYSDTCFYFVSVNSPNAPRIGNLDSPSATDIRLSTSMEHVHHETEQSNLCAGSINWLGETFSSSGQSRTVTLSTPDPAAGEDALFFIQTAAQTNSGAASFSIQVAGESILLTHQVTANSNGPTTCSDFQSSTRTIRLSGSQTQVTCQYEKNTAASNGYIDQISIVYPRTMSVSSQPLFFRNPESIGKAATYAIQSGNDFQVWDITDISDIRQAALSRDGSQWTFSAQADSSLHEYVAFTASSVRSPFIKGVIPAQNLHGAINADYVIVTHPAFASYAEELAGMHRERNGYNVLVASTEEVYNEFSSGAKDPSAIRLFMKNLWDHSDTSRRPRYLLLFGAASYDYKNKLGSLSDFVPTFESYSNGHEGGGDPIEDNFGYLGDNEGFSPQNRNRTGDLDIAVGRLPVRTAEDAAAVTEKADIYSSPEYISNPNDPNMAGNFGDWRNEISFVTDDGFEQVMEDEILAGNWPAELIPASHINKLYSDAYERTISTTSTRVIGLEEDLKNAIEKGNFFVGYFGHSGWDAWSDERILSIDAINQLEESYAYPIMIASSCTFGYFDQTNRPSGAELLVNRPHAGSIAIVATSRTAYRNEIEDFHKKFIMHAAQKEDGRIPTIGDAYLYAKRNNTDANGHRYVLLGDPGLKTAVPEYDVRTIQVNGKLTDFGTGLARKDSLGILDETPGLDTLKALSTISLEGCITDEEGNIVEDFNGMIVTKVYDKAVTETTMGQYDSHDRHYNEAVPYSVQNSILFQGYSEVEGGRFTVNFIVPKDIQYNYGTGRILYYAYSETTDAHGSFSDIIVGGFNSEAVLDTNPPIVDLYINRDNYIQGTVGESPYLYAEISDNFGINTTGSGIGHNMTLVIDEDFDNPVIVNNLFRYNPGSFNEGSLSYPLNLERGEHTAQLKVWNINNISTTASITFNIGSSQDPAIFDIRAYPNPVRDDYVDIYFNHNGYGGGIEECEVNIFNLQGLRIASFDYPVDDASGYSIGPIRWDMSRTNGGRVQSGMYIAHIRAHHIGGAISHKTVKIIVVK